jgi:hypothetical protein
MIGRSTESYETEIYASDILALNSKEKIRLKRVSVILL